MVAQEGTPCTGNDHCSHAHGAHCRAVPSLSCRGLRHRSSRAGTLSQRHRLQPAAVAGTRSWGNCAAAHGQRRRSQSKTGRSSLDIETQCPRRLGCLALQLPSLLPPLLHVPPHWCRAAARGAGSSQSSTAGPPQTLGLRLPVARRSPAGTRQAIQALRVSTPSRRDVQTAEHQAGRLGVADHLHCPCTCKLHFPGRPRH